MDCIAFEQNTVLRGKFGNCRIVGGIDRIIVALRGPGQRPVSTVAPKVNS